MPPFLFLSVVLRSVFHTFGREFPRENAKLVRRTGNQNLNQGSESEIRKIRSRGRVARQSSAKACTAVRIRSGPR